MSIFDFFDRENKKTASVAKERLQIILAHERIGRNTPDYLPALQRDLIAVIGRYVKINPEDIIVRRERQDDLEILEVKIELPENYAEMTFSPPSYSKNQPHPRR